MKSMFYFFATHTRASCYELCNDTNTYTCDFLPEIKGFCCARPLARMIRFMHADTTLGFSAIALRER